MIPIEQNIQKDRVGERDFMGRAKVRVFQSAFSKIQPESEKEMQIGS